LIDVELQLRRVVETVLAYLREQRILRAAPRSWSARTHQRFVAEVAAISSCIRNRSSYRVRAPAMARAERSAHREIFEKVFMARPTIACALFDLAGSFVPVLEVHEGLARVLTLTREAETRNDERGMDARLPRPRDKSAPPAWRLRAYAIASRRPAT
jgi:hypothetical protein